MRLGRETVREFGVEDERGQFELKKYDLDFNNWDDTCGDGCCYSFYTDVLINGNRLLTMESASSELYDEMKHFVDLLNAGETSFMFDLTETLEIGDEDRDTECVGCLDDSTMLNGILLSTTYYTNNPFGLVLTGLGIGYSERIWSSDAHPRTYEGLIAMTLTMDEERLYDEYGNETKVFDRYPVETMYDEEE